MSLKELDTKGKRDALYRSAKLIGKLVVKTQTAIILAVWLKATNDDLITVLLGDREIQNQECFGFCGFLYTSDQKSQMIRLHCSLLIYLFSSSRDEIFIFL